MTSLLLSALVFIPAHLQAEEAVVEKVAGGFVSAEGPLWHPDGYLLFSDVHDGKIVRMYPDGRHEVWFDQGKKTNGLALSADKSTLYACCYSERELIAIDMETRNWKVLADSWMGREFNNVNDISLDKMGNVYFTDPKWGAGPDDIQGVYVFSQDGVTTLAARLDHQPNGIAISRDGQWVFVSRSGARDIWKFRLDSGSRRLVEGRQWASVESEPDGLTIDREGNVYVALAGNGKLCVLSPDGSVKDLIPIVERMATNCEFQGDDESILYVTCGGKKEEKTAAIYRVRFP